MHASKFTKFKFIVRDARVFPGIWFDFIYPHILSLFLACIASVSARVRRGSWDVANSFFATPQIYVAADKNQIYSPVLL